MWNRPVHIKLYATDLYLAVCSASDARQYAADSETPELGLVNSDLEIGLVNARWRKTPQATWFLDPVQKDMDHIMFGSYVRLVSASKMWLHCQPDVSAPTKPQPVLLPVLPIVLIFFPPPTPPPLFLPLWFLKGKPNVIISYVLRCTSE